VEGAMIDALFNVAIFAALGLCALSGSVRGRISEFSDAHKGRASLRSRE